MKLIRYFILIALFSTFQVIIFGQCNMLDQLEKIEVEINAGNYLVAKSLIEEVAVKCKDKLNKKDVSAHWFAILKAKVDYNLQPDTILVHSVKIPFEYFLKSNKIHSSKYATATII
ncbi:MAG TPA: hypothetical protein PLC27_02220 [Saprospiraceae bacterium]|nr:hypothetical protein [Saprospiraceae bacterium]